MQTFQLAMVMGTSLARQNVVVLQKRNPGWTRDELILALDVYLRFGVGSQSAPENRALSESLSLMAQIVPGRKGPSYRNENGVYMKLCNFLRLDPRVPGVGLRHGGKLEAEVWQSYYSEPGRLKEEADTIRAGIEILKRDARALDETDIVGVEGFPEGKLKEVVHKTRERNPRLIQAAKVRMLQRQGFLACEACGTRLGERYGLADFVEAHHNKPLSLAVKERRASIKDISLLCPNCHRAIHLARPWLSVRELRARLAKLAVIKTEPWRS